MSKACSRRCIIQACKYYGFSGKEFVLLFLSLILPILVFGIEVWGCASYSKYLICYVDNFLKRSYKYGENNRRSQLCFATLVTSSTVIS